MNIREIREKDEKEIKEALFESQDGLRDIRFQIASKEIKNHQEYKKKRRDIARMLTVLSERA